MYKKMGMIMGATEGDKGMFGEEQEKWWVWWKHMWLVYSHKIEKAIEYILYGMPSLYEIQENW